jgi:hypothetical protein
MQQAIIGFDAMEMLSEMESLGTSEIDFGVDEIEDEDSDVEDGGDEDEDDDDYDEVWFLFLFSPFLLLGFSFKMHKYLNNFFPGAFLCLGCRTWWLFLMIRTRKMILMRNLETGQN